MSSSEGPLFKFNPTERGSVRAQSERSAQARSESARWQLPQIHLHWPPDCESQTNETSWHGPRAPSQPKPLKSLRHVRRYLNASRRAARASPPRQSTTPLAAGTLELPSLQNSDGIDAPLDQDLIERDPNEVQAEAEAEQPYRKVMIMCARSEMGTHMSADDLEIVKEEMMIPLEPKEPLVERRRLSYRNPCRRNVKRGSNGGGVALGLKC